MQSLILSQLTYYFSSLLFSFFHHKKSSLFYQPWLELSFRAIYLSLLEFAFFFFWVTEGNRNKQKTSNRPSQAKAFTVRITTMGSFFFSFFPENVLEIQNPNE